MSGEQVYWDHGPTAPLRVKSINVLAVTCAFDGTPEATIYGVATVESEALPYASGTFPFRIRLRDGGEPPSSDTYGILVGNAYYSGEMPLQGGNVQIHRSPGLTL